MDKYKSETEEDFFYKIFNWMPENVISDEYYEKNATLFQDISSAMYDYNQVSSKLSAESSRKAIEIVFRCILKHGLR
jgi:hypothetical protein